MSEKIWSDDAWEDYLYWQTQDKKTLKRINQLVQDIERNGCMKGIGKPEPLTGDLQGEYSRRINGKDRPANTAEQPVIASSAPLLRPAPGPAGHPAP